MSKQINYTIERVDPAQWDALVYSMPQRTVFHHRAWLEGLRSAYGFELQFAAARHDGHCIGVWPCVVTRKGPFRVLGSPLPGSSTAYMGLLLSNQADSGGVLRAFMNDSMFRRCAFFACRIMDHAGTELDLAPMGFVKTERFETYLIDLTQSEEQLWSNLKGECRNRVRKARKAGIETRIEEGPQFLDDFWAMSKEVFARSGIKPTFSREFLGTMWQNFSSAGNICILSAYHKGRRIGTLVLPHDDKVMYYWAGGSFGEFGELAPNNLMHWNAILEAKRRGLTYYDFISTRGGPGQFKKTFGPVAREVCSHWELARSSLVRWMKDRYERHLRSKRQATPAS
jgi:predicted N-acyltransferase